MHKQLSAMPAAAATAATAAAAAATAATATTATAATAATAAAATTAAAGRIVESEPHRHFFAARECGHRAGAPEVRSGALLHTHEVVGQGPGDPRGSTSDDRRPTAFKVQGPVRVGEVCVVLLESARMPPVETERPALAWPRHSRDTAEIQPRYSRDTAEIQPRCNLGSSRVISGHLG